LHKLVKCYARKTLRVLAQVTSWSCRAGCWPQGKGGHLFPRCARRSGNPHGSRPGSQAPNAPPAL